ncbi:MAG TPA: hypothetical protein PKN48_00670 [Bacteroidales bacterium]|nr:hypothetical protein [Bacteroidales bacterium]
MSNIAIIATAITRDKDGNLLKEINFPIKENEAYVTRSLIDGAGNIIATEKNPMRSFVYNFTKFLYGAMTGESQTFIYTSGADGVVHPKYIDVVTVDTTNANHGIWVGEDDGDAVPLSPDNFTLGDRILHGESTGELSHDSGTVSDSTLDVQKYYVRLGRRINNYTAAVIEVKEIGIVGLGSDAKYILYIRDLFDDTGSPLLKEIPINNSLYITYDFYIVKDSGYTKNIVKILEALFSADKDVALLDIDGTEITAASTDVINEMLLCNVASGEDNYGIVIGNGVGDTDFDSLGLISKILNGDLLYGDMVLTAPSHQSGQQQFKLSRVFTNNTGSTISTSEIALYGKGSGVGHRACFARIDTIGVPVVAGGTVEIIFTIRTLI